MPLKFLQRAEAQGVVPTGFAEVATKELTGEINACPERQGDVGFALTPEGTCEPFLFSQEFTTGQGLRSLAEFGLSIATGFASGGPVGGAVAPLVGPVSRAAQGAIPGVALQAARTGLTTLAGAGQGGPMPNGNGFFSGLGDVFTGLFQTGVEQIGLPLLTQQLFPPQTPQISPQITGPPSILQPPQAQPVMAAAAPAVAGAAAGVFRVGQIAINTVVAAMRSAGVQATARKVVSFVKRFGPEAAAGFFGGFVGADLAQRAVIEAAFAKGRRMNPGNVKALRRSIRRVQSFHKLCSRADVLQRAAGRRRTAKRCGVCRAVPCRC